MSGGDVDTVMEAIQGVALCVRCIARKTGVAPLSVITALTFIARTEKITEGVKRCNVCLLVTDTHKI